MFLYIICYTYFMNTIEDFIDQIIKEKGFDTKDPEVLVQLKADLMERAENRINAMIITSISEDDMDDFNTVLDTNDEEKIQTFIRTHVPDIDDRVALELAQFKMMYLG